jgi:hypothetical protein
MITCYCLVLIFNKDIIHTLKILVKEKVLLTYWICYIIMSLMLAFAIIATLSIVFVNY